MSIPSRQVTDTVFMVRPHRFTFNSLTAADNHFQVRDEDTEAHAHEYALREFDDFVALLRHHGIKVVVAQDTATPETPDSIFPNNWFTTHDNGTLITYPMLAANRNQESFKPALYDTLVKEFAPLRRVDYRPLRDEGKVLEGTGCLILDREHRIAYACRSERISEELLATFCKEMNFRPLLFGAYDRNATPIYHTNVMMAIGEAFAVICLECITDAAERAEVEHSLTSTGHEIVDISLDQVYQFAGNMLSLRAPGAAQPLLVMSQQALDSLRPDQLEIIHRHATIVAPSLKTIETLGGGSARCMMGEIFSHKKLH